MRGQLDQIIRLMALGAVRRSRSGIGIDGTGSTEARSVDGLALSGCVRMMLSGTVTRSDPSAPPAEEQKSNE